MGGQTDGYSAEELEAVLPLHTGNSSRLERRRPSEQAQVQTEEKRLWKHHSRELLRSSFRVVLLQLGFPRLSQMDLVITPQTAKKPKVHILIPYIVLRM